MASLNRKCCCNALPCLSSYPCPFCQTTPSWYGLETRVPLLNGANGCYDWPDGTSCNFQYLYWMQTAAWSQSPANAAANPCLWEDDLFGQQPFYMTRYAGLGCAGAILSSHNLLYRRRLTRLDASTTRIEYDFVEMGGGLVLPIFRGDAVGKCQDPVEAANVLSGSLDGMPVLGDPAGVVKLFPCEYYFDEPSTMLVAPDPAYGPVNPDDLSNWTLSKIGDRIWGSTGTNPYIQLSIQSGAGGANGWAWGLTIQGTTNSWYGLLARGPLGDYEVFIRADDPKRTWTVS